MLSVDLAEIGNVKGVLVARLANLVVDRLCTLVESLAN
jgi:hypothetical protein